MQDYDEEGFGQECKEPEDESWLLTYADAVTLLMTFFVLLLSVSVVDQSKFEETVEAIQDGGFDKQKEKAFPFAELKKKLDTMVEEKDLNNSVKVARTPNGITVELSSNVLYGSGSAEIREAALPALTQLSKEIKDFEYKNYTIEVEGHSDDVAIHTQQFPSNWELSVNRATNIVRFFSKMDIPRTNMKATGYADTRPLVPNKDAKGNPIEENRAKNRRIVINIIRK